ncbi:MAG: hypothetical protein ACP5IE_10310, partial [Infirmifilum sp.]
MTESNPQPDSKKSIIQVSEYASRVATVVLQTAPGPNRTETAYIIKISTLNTGAWPEAASSTSRGR